MYHTQHEVILDHMTLSSNEGQVGYPLLKKACELSWYKIYKSTKESIVRKWYEVDNGIVKYPKSLETLLGVMVVDHCGDLKALYEDNVRNIILKPAKKCKCTSCDTEECLCPTIQDPIVQTDVVIEGTTYTNKSITRVLKNGDVVEETYTWAPSFDESGAFIEAQQIETHVTKCKLDILSCGCPANTEENVTLLTSCGCISECFAPYMRDRYPALYNPFGYYKAEEEARRIHVFNSEGRKSDLTQVLLVFQSNGSDALVNDYTRPALIALLDYSMKQYSPMYDHTDKEQARKNWNREEYEMLKYLNPIPYEWLVQVDDATRKYGKAPYYARPHSDFVRTPAACCPTAGTTNITNIIGGSGGGGGGTVNGDVLKLIVDAGEGNPVSGLSTFQHNSLRGLGDLSEDKVEFIVEKTEMKNWGLEPDFTMDKVTGTITFITGYVWQTGNAVKIPLNQ